MQSHAQLAHGSEESPYGWAVQFKDGVEICNTHLNAIACGPNSFTESESFHVLSDVNQDVQGQILSPGLRRMNPTWGSEVRRRIITVDL